VKPYSAHRATARRWHRHGLEATQSLANECWREVGPEKSCTAIRSVCGSFGSFIRVGLSSGQAYQDQARPYHPAHILEKIGVGMTTWGTAFRQMVTRIRTALKALLASFQPRGFFYRSAFWRDTWTHKLDHPTLAALPPIRFLNHPCRCFVVCGLAARRK